MTNQVLVDIIVGARPNFMKASPIIRAIDERRKRGGSLAFRLVHTGQHYDEAMSKSFFDQLGIPEPTVNLGIGSGSPSEQAAGIMVGYERLLRTSKPHVCIVVGDVTSTMACAITARKLNVPVAHVEAGIRSGDWTMPEEINRVVTDSISNWFFTTSRVANENLRTAGVDEDRIFFVGNTMIDTLLKNLANLRAPDFFSQCGLAVHEYFVLTLHRPSNVDASVTFAKMLSAVAEGARGEPVVFPIHPRTAKTLRELPGFPWNVILVDPQPYLEFNWLVKHAKAVITDSGGVTEESTVLGVPCMTLRTSTERPETITVGTNELLGTDPAALKPAFDRLFAGDWKKGGIPEKWDGRTSERIVDALEQLLGCS